MLKTTLLTLTTLSTALFSNNKAEFPRNIDLHPGRCIQKSFWAQEAFNSAPEIGIFVQHLRQLYDIDVAVETGTFKGRTTHFFANTFKEVHTIEVSPDWHNQAKAFLAPHPHVFCHLGSSENVLADILPSLQDRRILFYLDAHWNEFWPLLDEIRNIGKTHKDNCIIVIDDFKVPGRSDLPYDRYGRDECSYDYIREVLDDAFTDYTFHYILPRDVDSHAKFLVIPTNWVEITP